MSALARPSWTENLRVGEILRKETVGGILLLIATVIALVWSNSAIADSYFAVRDFTIGPEVLHLNLSLGTWAADGLLAIFFFVAGLELKREFVAGELRKFSAAVVPVSAAIAGVVVPALIYTVINLQSGLPALNGWAIPTATDIAFALAVLAVVSTHLPAGLRTFLLTLAVVDDLLAIAIIAFFYTDELEPGLLLLALVPLALFAVLVQKRIRAWYLLLPLAFAAWALVHASGVHATVAGVLLGFVVPVLRSKKNGGPKAGPGMAEYLEHKLRPMSAGFAVPVFAFFSAGVAIGGLEGFTESFTDTIAIGIMAALVIGKLVGVFGMTLLITKTTRATLDKDLGWVDVLGLSLLTGVGFTVSLLIAELSFGQGTSQDDHAKVGVLAGSVIAAALAAIVLRFRNRHYRKLERAEAVDANLNGVPDVYEP